MCRSGRRGTEGRNKGVGETKGSGVFVLRRRVRRELGPAGFEAVHAGFQGGDVRFESVDALVELGK
jgi:hypothetical protein